MPCMTQGKLLVVGTPIGNLGDLSPRAARALAEADRVFAEDTRVARRLLSHAGVEAPLSSLHQHNEARAGARALAALEAGETVAIVSDAGMPGISDPGEPLVREAAARGVRVEPIPGPCALIAALVGSGLPTGRFAFEGFLPSSPRLRRKALKGLAAEERTLVFYEAPHRLAESLADMAGAFGAERPACVARELTKLHEEFVRAALGELAARYAAAAPRGEIVLVVGGAAPAGEAPEDGDWEAALAAELASGASPAAAAKAIARRFGVERQAAYRKATAEAP